MAETTRGSSRMVDEFVLKNGLRVIAEYIPHFPSVSVGLWIGAGSMYESEAESGLSHFVEHMLFKSTHKRTTREIAVEMDAMGRSVKNQFKYADRIGAKKTIVIGESELEKGTASVKDMATGDQKEVALAKLAEALK